MTRRRRDVEHARDLADQDLSISEIARRVGVSRSTVRHWIETGFETTLAGRTDDTGRRDADCGFCRHVRNLTESSYSYLLGLYLGDGHITKHPRGVYKLRIFQDVKYPILIHQCMIAMRWVIPSQVGVFQRQRCKEIYSFSKHWPCLFPQHGPGMKHERSIVLEPWQRWVAIDREPELLLRGLIHSDGWRGTNAVSARGKRYEYRRYMFSNRSADIRRIFTDACDRAGIEWRQNYEWSIAISRRESVEKMDRFIGPKF